MTPAADASAHSSGRQKLDAAVPLFSLTLLASALLLFSIQPMFAKMILPMLGGTPAVWNTCAVFFQAVLLLGYGYAHLSTRWLGARRQAVWHLALLLLPALCLPFAIPAGWAPPADANPIPWLLTLLTVTVGLPFFVLSATAPLLQQWFASSAHPAAKDPYFLYAASNLGSLLALLGYLAWLEPRFRLGDQATLWTAGYGLFAALVAGCAFWLRRVPAAIGAESPGQAAGLDGELTASRRMRWVCLAAVPSSLMLGVSTYLSTDIAAVPLMWVVPLALYLLTFMLVFARRAPLPHWLMLRALPLAVLPLAITMLAGLMRPMFIVVPLHLLSFFIAAMVCHGELAADRPDAGHLTEYYVWMSVGGVLGGLFNALLAPMVFETVLEYPIALVMACLLWPGMFPDEEAPRLHWLDLALPLALAGLLTGLTLQVRSAQPDTPMMEGLMDGWYSALVLGPAALVCISFRFRPLRFGLGLAAFLLVGMFVTTDWTRVLLLERSFFGVHQVILKRGPEPVHILQHGTTHHGLQSRIQRRRPLVYYELGGPVSQVFDHFAGDTPRLRQVAVVGLGTGSLACYGSAGQRWTFYEIDPVVKRIATDPSLFSFLRDCLEEYRIVLGDARLKLKDAADGQYDLIAVDAFNSDAIPIHLLTREAIELYLRKLAPGGLLLMHISSRYLILEPVLGGIAEAMGIPCYAQLLTIDGRTVALWTVLANRREDLGALADDPRWRRVARKAGVPVWTDDFSNILSVFSWR